MVDGSRQPETIKRAAQRRLLTFGRVRCNRDLPVFSVISITLAMNGCYLRNNGTEDRRILFSPEAEEWSSAQTNRGMTMCNEIRELNDIELDNVSGGDFIDDAVDTVVGAAKSVWNFLTDDSNKYDPVKACPECYRGGGHGVRG